MVNRTKTMGLDGGSEEILDFGLQILDFKSEIFILKSKINVQHPGVGHFPPPVENFNCFASLLKQTFTKPNAANGNHKRTIRTFHPYRRP